MNRIAILISILTISFNAFSLAPDEIKGSVAVLATDVGDLEVSMLKNDQGNWVLKSHLDGGSVFQREEKETFSFDEKGIKPLHYEFKQRLIFKKIKATAKFDWSERIVTFKEGKKEGSYDLQRGTLGPSTAQLQLRHDFKKLDINSLPEELKYVVYWKGAVKERTYTIDGEETIETPLGIFKAYKVVRIFPDGDERAQTYWLAPKLDFSIIRILNVDGRETDIRIKSFEIIS